MNRTTPSIVLLAALSLPAAGQEAKPPAEQEKVSEPAQPEPVLKLTLPEHDELPARTGVLRFDIDEGKRIHAWSFPQESDYHIFNDLVVGPKGEVYATTTPRLGVPTGA
jgi:sugar lactone lactonase YvrE